MSESLQPETQNWVGLKLLQGNLILHSRTVVEFCTMAQPLNDETTAVFPRARDVLSDCAGSLERQALTLMHEEPKEMAWCAPKQGYALRLRFHDNVDNMNNGMRGGSATLDLSVASDLRRTCSPDVVPMNWLWFLQARAPGVNGGPPSLVIA